MTRVMRGVAVLAASILLSALSPAAFAAPVRVGFAGTVTEIDAPTEAALGGSIQLGTPFSGYIVYDDSVSASDGYGELDPMPPNPPAWALYFPSQSAAHGEIGDFVRDGGVGSIDLYDNELYLDEAGPSGVFITTGFFDPAVPDDEIALTGMWLTAQGAGPGQPLHGTSLQQAIPWSIESFPTTSAIWFFEQGAAGFSLRGIVTELVPEPEVGALAALGLLALGFRRIRR